MKHRDLRLYLHDAIQACDLILQFSSGRTLDDYNRDAMFRSAVERQLMILGEALAQGRKLDPRLGEQVPDLQEIIGLRNLLVHRYEAVDSEIIWAVVQSDVRLVQELLRDF